VRRRQREKRHIAVNAGERPAIHVIEVPALAPRRHAHREHVLLLARQGLGDVERGRVVPDRDPLFEFPWNNCHNQSTFALFLVQKSYAL
jgi:hypothetical protein